MSEYDIHEDKADVCAQASIWGISEFMNPEHELYITLLRKKMELLNGDVKMTQPCRFWDEYLETCDLRLECFYSDNWEAAAESCMGYQYGDV